MIKILNWKSDSGCNVQFTCTKSCDKKRGDCQQERSYIEQRHPNCQCQELDKSSRYRGKDGGRNYPSIEEPK